MVDLVFLADAAGFHFSAPIRNTVIRELTMPDSRRCRCGHEFYFHAAESEKGERRGCRTKHCLCLHPVDEHFRLRLPAVVR